MELVAQGRAGGGVCHGVPRRLFSPCLGSSGVSVQKGEQNSSAQVKGSGRKGQCFHLFSTRARELEWLWRTVVGSAQDWSSVCVSGVGAGGVRGSGVERGEA